MFASHCRMATVLVVEDDVAIRNLCVIALRRRNLRAICANDGAVGLRLYREHRPSCILMDVMMPVLNGHQLFTELIGEGVSPSQIIVMTAFSSSKSGDFPGAFDFFHKPFDVEMLCDVVANCVVAHSTPPPSQVTIPPKPAPESS